MPSLSAGQVPIEEKERTLRAVEDKLLEVAVRETGKRPEEIVIRDVLPATDLGLSAEKWEVSYSAAGWTTWINKELDDDQFLVIYGVACADTATPYTTALRFKVGTTGATTKDVVQIEDAFAEENRVKYLRKPLIYKGGDTVYIEAYGTEAGTDRLILKALIAEPKGKTVSV